MLIFFFHFIQSYVIIIRNIEIINQVKGLGVMYCTYLFFLVRKLNNSAVWKLISCACFETTA